MRTIGTMIGCSRRHVSTVAQAVRQTQKIGPYRWPLDVGDRTVKEIEALAPWLRPGTIQRRLDRGERKLDALIAPVNKARIAEQGRANAAKRFEAERKAQRIASERIAYFRLQAKGHKEL